MTTRFSALHALALIATLATGSFVAAQSYAAEAPAPDAKVAPAPKAPAVSKAQQKADAAFAARFQKASAKQRAALLSKYLATPGASADRVLKLLKTSNPVAAKDLFDRVVTLWTANPKKADELKAFTAAHADMMVEDKTPPAPGEQTPSQDTPQGDTPDTNVSPETGDAPAPDFGGDLTNPPANETPQTNENPAQLNDPAIAPVNSPSKSVK